MHLTKIAFGATRRVMTGKHGNKNFYKGTFIFVIIFVVCKFIFEFFCTKTLLRSTFHYRLFAYFVKVN